MTEGDRAAREFVTRMTQAHLGRAQNLCGMILTFTSSYGLPWPSESGRDTTERFGRILKIIETDFHQIYRDAETFLQATQLDPSIAIELQDRGDHIEVVAVNAHGQIIEFKHREYRSLEGMIEWAIVHLGGFSRVDELKAPMIAAIKYYLMRGQVEMSGFSTSYLSENFIRYHKVKPTDRNPR